MTAGSTVFWLSLGGLFVLSVLGFRKDRSLRALLFYLAVLTASGACYFAVFQSDSHVQAKGVQPNEVSFIIVLYVCMLLGMTCHYLYTLLMIPKESSPVVRRRESPCPHICLAACICPSPGRAAEYYC